MGEGNRISGNGGNGISIFGSGTMSNTVSGNFVGTDLSGTVPIGNQNGIVITEAASHNLVGGDEEGERNVIGGNLGADIAIYGMGTMHNVVANNLIGTDSSGKVALRTLPPGGGCCTAGVSVAGGAQQNTIGPGNVINGNFFGVALYGAGTDGNIVIGNLIGTDASGTARIGNFCQGINVSGGAQRNRIGGPTSRERNIISGNGVNGVEIGDRGSNTVMGNFVGTDISGTIALGNGGPGGGIHVWSAGNQIGGMNAGERNIVSGNMDSGIVLQGSDATGNTVMGNYVGVDVSGRIALGNKSAGIAAVTVAPNNLIKGNVVSGNGGDGIHICGADYNVVAGNLVGTDLSGTLVIPNGGGGVRVCPGSSFNRVGGTQPDERNVLSGNMYGVVFGGAGNLVLGNLIGTDISGTQSLGNWASGVHLDPGGRNFVGGATRAERNVISGNGIGVWIFSDYTYVLGNLIGTDITGSENRGNVGSGIETDAGKCIIQGNTIAHSPNGVIVTVFPHTTVRRNSIHSNANRGIALYGGGNAMLPAPVIRAVDGTSVSGTACANCTVEVFSDDEDEGGIYEGTAIAGASGAFVFRKPDGLTGPYITATATDRDGNTSEFSQPVRLWRYRLWLPVFWKR
jgi:titin